VDLPAAMLQAEVFLTLNAKSSGSIHRYKLDCIEGGAGGKVGDSKMSTLVKSRNYRLRLTLGLA
jgi:hypothetical protein